MTKTIFTILGASGQVGSVISEKLLRAGHSVRAISRSQDRLKNLIKLGAEPVVAELEDIDALTRAFHGVNAVFTMIPPDMVDPDYRSFQAKTGAAIVMALKAAEVPFVVNLSSLGAELSENTGPILGLHHQEDRLNRLSSTHVLHLRPGYFMENLFFIIDPIRSQNIAPGCLRPDLKLAMIATRDIGTVAAQRLSALDFHGKSTLELLGQRDISMNEIVPLLGKAIGKPHLSYLPLPYSTFSDALKTGGLPPVTVSLTVEMLKGLNENRIKPLEARSALNSTPTSIENFSRIFASLYASVAS